MAWKTGAVPVVAVLGLETDAKIFFLFFFLFLRIGVPRSTTRAAASNPTATKTTTVGLEIPIQRLGNKFESTPWLLLLIKLVNATEMVDVGGRRFVMSSRLTYGRFRERVS